MCVCVCGNLKQRDHFDDKCRWESNIKTELEEIGLEGINCISAAQCRDRWGALVDAEINFRGSIVKFLTVGNSEV